MFLFHCSFFSLFLESLNKFGHYFWSLIWFDLFQHQLPNRNIVLSIYFTWILLQCLILHSKMNSLYLFVNLVYSDRKIQFSICDISILAWNFDGCASLLQNEIATYICYRIKIVRFCLLLNSLFLRQTNSRLK